MAIIIKLLIICVLIELNYSEDDPFAFPSNGDTNSGDSIEEDKHLAELLSEAECDVEVAGVKRRCTDGKQCVTGKCYFRRYPGELCTIDQECLGNSCDVQNKKCRNVCQGVYACKSEETQFCDKGKQTYSYVDGSCQLKRDNNANCYNYDNCKSRFCSDQGYCTNKEMRKEGDICQTNEQCESNYCDLIAVRTYSGPIATRKACIRLKGMRERCVKHDECITKNCVINYNNGNRKECLSVNDNSVGVRKDNAYLDPLNLANGGVLNIGVGAYNKLNNFLDLD